MNYMLHIIVHGMKHIYRQYLKEKLITFGIVIGESNERKTFRNA